MARAVINSESHSLAALSKGSNAVKMAMPDVCGKTELSATEMEALAAYCLADVNATQALYNRLIEGYPESELELIDLVIEMGVRAKLELNKPMLELAIDEAKTERESCIKAAGISEKILASNQQFARHLISLGATPPVKISITTGKETTAFSKADVEYVRFQDEHPELRTLFKAREAVKSTLPITRTQAFIDIANSGKLAVPLNYGATITGRLSGSCLTGDTQILVLRDGNQKAIRLDALKVDDLVWDGEEFVKHEGLAFQGYAEVIHWDNITGTADHVVFTEVGAIPLSEAIRGGHKIQSAALPGRYDAETPMSKSAGMKSGKVAAVFDILNCGPRQRFMANGKLVHNSGINLQNMPRGSALRKSMTAPEGWVLVVGDLGQIEARVMAVLAGETSMIEVFEAGLDLYTEYAKVLYKCDGIDKNMMKISKLCSLALQYQMGYKKFRANLEKGFMGAEPIVLTEEDAEHLVAIYRESHPAIVSYWRQCQKKISLMTQLSADDEEVWLPFRVRFQEVVLPNGMTLNYDGLHTSEDGATYVSGGNVDYLYGGKLTNNLVQATSRIIMTDAWREIAKKYDVVMSVHDELVILAREDEAETAMKDLEAALTKQPSFLPPIKLTADCGFARNYSK